jgi:Ser/Thr protein kinase RdoA (MazF antagonist)
VELLAEGRMAEVYAYGDDRVVKLDRPEWSGVSIFESDILTKLAAAGLPVARSHGTVTIENRCGVVLDRISGRSLTFDLLESSADQIAAMAARFAALQATINGITIDGLPDLVERLRNEIGTGPLPDDVGHELLTLLDQLDDGSRSVCHYDFHPSNVLAGSDAWVVIDWLTVAGGPPVADMARTLVIWGQHTDAPLADFMAAYRTSRLDQLGIDAQTCAAWVRIVGGARLAEGFDQADSAWLRGVAEGSITPHA